jgi:hypothetical protein
MGTSDTELAQVIQEYRRYYTAEQTRAEAATWAKWETPQHRVTVGPFYMGRLEVTQAQWREVALLPRVDRDLDIDPSHFKGDDLPVEQVSWDDAMEFCAGLSRKTELTYCLPSEAEWEYAWRGGTSTAFAVGDTISPDLVNYSGHHPYAAAAEGADREKTVSVGSLGVANGFGDVRNAWECAGVVFGHLARPLLRGSSGWERVGHGRGSERPGAARRFLGPLRFQNRSAARDSYPRGFPQPQHRRLSGCVGGEDISDIPLYARTAARWVDKARCPVQCAAPILRQR